MYFSRIQPSSAGSGSSLPTWNPYQAHQFVWNFFSEGAKGRDFLFRMDFERGRPRYYVVSAREPREPKPKTRAPAYKNSGWLVAHKPFQPRLAAGDPLVFSLRVNPVVTKSEGGRRQRHDVVMDRKYALDREARTRTTQAVLAHQAGMSWLATRAPKHGFRFDETSVRVENYRQHRFRKKGRREVSIGTLDFQGLLEVTHVPSFTQTLFNGIGPAKAFGCGLLLVRRP